MSPASRNLVENARRKPSVRACLGLQLSVGSGNEINNPPPLLNGSVRSTVMYEQILKGSPFPIDLSAVLQRETGLSLDSYVDLTLGSLTNFLGRSPEELRTDGSLSIFKVHNYFGTSISPEISRKFWDLESSNIDDLKHTILSEAGLVAHQDFTAFRKKPFLRLGPDTAICLVPHFVQEKLEMGGAFDRSKQHHLM